MIASVLVEVLPMEAQHSRDCSALTWQNGPMCGCDAVKIALKRAAGAALLSLRSSQRQRSGEATRFWLESEVGRPCDGTSRAAFRRG